MTSISKPSKQTVGLVITLGIFSVSTAAIFIRLAFEAANTQGVGFSLVLAASRLAIAAIFLLPTWRNHQTQELQRSAFLYSIAAGVCLAVHFATWISSLSYTSIAASTTLVTTNPVWVALISWLWFKERPTWLTSLGIAIALSGGILIGVGSSGTELGSDPLVGNSLALIGAIAVSFYFLLGREAQRQGLGIGRHAALTYTTAAVVLLPLPLFFNTGYFGYASEVYLWIGLMAIFPQLIGHTSFNWAVRWISPTLVTLTILAEPVGSSILGFLVFRENPGVIVGIGAIVILVGVAIAALGTAQK
jgi:drug/metabolite transporter (DMT)-like permease